MKRILLTAGLACAGLSSFAQSAPQLPRCGFELVWKNLEQNVPNFRQQYDAQFANAQTPAKPAGQVYHIPVVFHVVYDTPEKNLPDSVILNQLNVLNQAYRKTHADTGSLRAIFKPLSADAEIQFYLAPTDPNGNPTTGITRTQTTVPFFGDLFGLFAGDMSSIERIKNTAQGGQDSWNPSRYLNIWIADMSVDAFGQITPMILGIATPPMNPLPPNWGTDTTGFGSLKDGVIVQYQVVGNNNPTMGALSQQAGTAGRTLVHEVGHYLGLRHIWGDPASAAEECTPLGDDGIADTPPMASESEGGANCPQSTQNTCGAGQPGDMPDLWENYMDYSRDNCQSMFTHGQVAHMRTICGNQRDTLTSQWSMAVGNTTRPDVHSLIVYPQPATSILHIAFEGRIDELSISNLMGQKIQIADAPSVDKSRTISVSGMPAGVYFLNLRSGQHWYSKRITLAP